MRLLKYFGAALFLFSLPFIFAAAAGAGETPPEPATEDVSIVSPCGEEGHTPGTWVCAEAGTHVSVCERCGEPLSGACVYTAYDTPPTQTEPGRHVQTCTVCGGTVSEDTLPPESARKASKRMGDVDRDGAVTSTDARLILRASLQLEPIAVELLPQADLDEDGVLSAYDARCAMRIGLSLDPERRHSISAKVNSNPSCTGQGSVTWSCDYCGFSERLIAPAKGHRWVNATAAAPKHCADCGKKITGWTQVGNDWYYFNADGSLTQGETLFNSSVNGVSGWLYLKNGKFVPSYRGALWFNGGRWIVEEGCGWQARTEAQITLFRAFQEVAKATTQDMTKSQKLRACFDYCKKAYKEYQPRYPHYTKVDWPVLYANDMFVRGGGNCFSYAAAFAYMAKAVGYTNVYCCNSGGHGWTEIDGLVYDPEWSRSHTRYSYYALSYDTKTDVNYKRAIAAHLDWMYVKI